MLNENIKALRKSKGLSQEELAVRLHVVRQTVSKWEQGLSVPDADLLIALSEALEAPVSKLLGETLAAPPENEPNELRAIAEKLESINLRLARRQRTARAVCRGLLIALCAGTAAAFAALAVLHSPYLGWDYSDPETAVAAAGLHALEWLFIRLAPALVLGSLAGLFLTRKR